MPTSPSINQRFQLSDNTTNRALETCPKIFCNKKSENESRKIQYRRSCSFRKPADKNKNKRRFSFSGDKKMIRKRFFKFPNGGNSRDPLNLGSFIDDVNQFSPKSSPVPINPMRSNVEVHIPKNIHDPLNLASGKEIEFNDSTRELHNKSRKRQRHRKPKKEDHENVREAKDVSAEESRIEMDDLLPNDMLSPQPNTVKDDEITYNDQLITESEKDPSSEVIKHTRVSTGSLKAEETFERKPVPKFKLRRMSSVKKAKHDKYLANTKKFAYGNRMTSCNHWNYYGFDVDPRIDYLRTEFFKDKDVLDIGCNTGRLTLFIAENLKPKKITGIDIDRKLLDVAESKVKKIRSHISFPDMPQSMPLLYGPLAKVMTLAPESACAFPNNVTFLEANYVPPSEDCLLTQKPEYDTILCLRVTKWIHLNFGDEGLKLAFKRMYAQLRMGGHLILEAQPWSTYAANKRITPGINKTYNSLEMRPEFFIDYLEEMGFSSWEIIGRPTNHAKGYKQDICILTKNLQEVDGEMLRGIPPMNYHTYANAPGEMLNASPMHFLNTYVHPHVEVMNGSPMQFQNYGHPHTEMMNGSPMRFRNNYVHPQAELMNGSPMQFPLVYPHEDSSFNNNYIYPHEEVLSRSPMQFMNHYLPHEEDEAGNLSPFHNDDRTSDLEHFNESSSSSSDSIADEEEH